MRMTLTVTVAQQKGGSGKTSLAAHLAVAWSNPSKSESGGAGEPLKVIALDLDPQESLAKWFDVRTARGESAGPLEVRRASGWRFTSELQRAQREADVVILDLPPGAEGPTAAAIRVSDLVVVPLQLSPMDLWATGPTIELAQRTGVEPVLVLNRVPARARLNDEVIAAAKTAKWQMATATLGNRVLFAASLLSGKGVTEEAPGSLAAAEMRLLARELMAKTKSLPRAA
jgi:chromosome partitioning protein